MKFNPLDYQRPDATGNFVLDEEYLFSCTYRDGWTRRLLSFRLFIDVYYECWGEIAFCIREKESKRIEKLLKFELPLEIKEIIDQMIDQEELDLKKYYSDFFMEDPQRVHFVINRKGISQNVGIAIMVKKLENPNESEKLLFLLQAAFDKIREDLYNEILLENNVAIETSKPKKKKRRER